MIGKTAPVIGARSIVYISIFPLDSIPYGLIDAGLYNHRRDYVNTTRRNISTVHILTTRTGTASSWTHTQRTRIDRRYPITTGAVDQRCEMIATRIDLAFVFCIEGIARARNLR
jgi:hypothetical protein